MEDIKLMLEELKSEIKEMERRFINIEDWIDEHEHKHMIEKEVDNGR